MVRGRRSAMFFTWVMGLVFRPGRNHQRGAHRRDRAAHRRPASVSHEELAYMVDSTASPAATVIPFNVWPIYVGGLVAGTIPLFETGQDGIEFFFRALPFNFYAILAITLTFLFAWELLPWAPGGGCARRSSGRAGPERPITTRPGPWRLPSLTQTRVPEGHRTGLEDFLVPIGVLLGIAIVPYLVTFHLLGREDPLLMIAEAFVLAVLAAMFLALAKGMSLATVVGRVRRRLQGRHHRRHHSRPGGVAEGGGGCRGHRGVAWWRWSAT
ncbi:MAG: hypothetical protein U5R48_13710 [Gammaproteobacteria bacterium]|nr:hypothetical protein [Gammaproteobacteria bacterium]